MTDHGQWPTRLGAPEELLRLPAETLAENRASRVLRVRLPEGTVIAKIYGCRALKGARANRSFAQACQLVDLGISVAQPIAATELPHGESLLLLSDVKGARTMRELWPAPGRLRRGILRQLAGIIAQLHSAGLAHTDPTLGNFLVEFANDTPRVIVIDFDAIRPANRRTQGRAMRDLRLLLQRIPMAPREQLWLIAQYCRLRTPRFEVRGVQQRLLTGCVRKYFCIAQQFGAMDWMVRRGAVPEVGPTCENVGNAIRSAAQLLKNSRNVTVARVAGASGRGLIVRRMNYGRLRHRVKDFFRVSRARRAFFRGLLLEQADVPTPRMLAVAEVRRFRWPVSAYTICDEVPNAQTLAEWVREGCRASRRVVERLAAVIAKMHNRGFVHRDLKGSNVLLDGELNPWLIDMDGVNFVREVSMREAVRDLAVLYRVVEKHALRRWLAVRFLKTYGKARRFSETDIATMWNYYPGFE